MSLQQRQMGSHLPVKSSKPRTETVGGGVSNVQLLLLEPVVAQSGASISQTNQINIAVARARQLSYPKYPGGFKQPHVFVFEVKN